MSRHSHIWKLVLIAVFMMGFASIAEAQATRTWVSGVGDDVNPCSRTAPCKTFAGAISKTAKDGEINCLDPGGYGAVTIVKSITIDCEDTQGSILASFVNGVIINITDAADIRKTVRLRGISINGASTGLDGVRILAANQVHLEELVIDGFTGDGVDVNPNNTTARLHVWNSSIRNCVGNGVLMTSLGTGTVLADIDNTTLSQNGDGVEANVNAHVTIKDSVIANNNVGVRTAGAANAEATVESTAILNHSNGVRVDLGTARVGNSVLNGNSVGLQNIGGTLKTFQNNDSDGNGANTGGVITLANPS